MSGTESLRATIFEILQRHGYYAEFISALQKPLPAEDCDDIWSIEIFPREGMSKFSKPLIIATEATVKCTVVRLAHSWADVWDITYDPLYEFRILSTPNTDPSTWEWIPENRYSTHQGGFVVLSSDALKKEAVAYSRDWALDLQEREYANVGQAVVKRLSAAFEEKKGGKTPFHLFSKLMEIIPLEDVKQNFKTYPKSFRAETALTSMTTRLGFDKTEAAECLTGVLLAQLIVNIVEPNNAEHKIKNIYALSVKGALVLRDVKAKRLTLETPDSVYKGSKGEVKTNVIYLDRDGSGNLVFLEGTMNVVFKHCFGEKVANFHKFENPNIIYTEGSPEVESLDGGPNGLIEIWPVFLKDKVVRLKGYTHAFTGADCVDWVLRCTSVVSRLEAISVASYFIGQAWIACVNPDDAAPPVVGSPSVGPFQEMDMVMIKDSRKSVYQPTYAGARFLGWDMNNPPTTGNAVSAFFSNKKKPETVVAGRRESRSGRASNDGSVDGEEGGRKSVGSAVSATSETARQGASKSLTLIPPGDTDEDLFGWESCHSNLISMDGAQSRSKANSGIPSALGTPTTGGSISKPSNADDPIYKIITAVRAKAFAIKKQAAATIQKDAPEFLPMDPTLPRDPLVAQAKGASHTQRLAMILENPDLCEQFRKYCHFMFSQENYNFWQDADAFRRLYSSGNTVIVPGQPLTYSDVSVDTSKVVPPLVQLVSHTMALYLKYIVDDGPYEINVGVLRKKKITATVATDALLPFFELINPDSIVQEERIDPKTVLLPGTENMLTGRLKMLEKDAPLNIGADLFDLAENHIFTLMATDSVPKFLKTPAYHNVMSALIKAGNLKHVDEVVAVQGSTTAPSAQPRESVNSLAKFAVEMSRSKTSLKDVIGVDDGNADGAGELEVSKDREQEA
ncbi:hypothetical protein HDU98_006992 [Podochytrium sp. JEL0797]|nr:hypothetical protein HDU98_006992 [Podochytrium sp. JEL0797]